MKKITQFLRFLALLFFLFLALAVCFVFNNILNQKIEEQRAITMESLEDFNTTNPEE